MPPANFDAESPRGDFLTAAQQAGLPGTGAPLVRGWRGWRARPGRRAHGGASGPRPGMPRPPAPRASKRVNQPQLGARGHHVSCFLSQVLGRRAQRGSISPAFREHSPSRPSRPAALSGSSSTPLQRDSELPKPGCRPTRRAPCSPATSSRHHPRAAGAPLALMKRSPRGASVRVCGAAVGLSTQGDRRKTRRGAPGVRLSGSRSARAPAGLDGRPRAALHLPGRYPMRPAEPAPPSIPVAPQCQGCWVSSWFCGRALWAPRGKVVEDPRHLA